jgi:rubrerythrin
MLSRRSFFRKILDNPEARALLMNSLAVGEADSAAGLDRAADHVSDPVLSRRIYRHFAEEMRHARVLGRRLEELGFEPEPLPPELDYEQYVRRYEMGLPLSRYDDPEPFSTDELIRFFVGCKAGEERACAEMQALLRDLAEDADTVKVLSGIYDDEIRHVSFATEELNRLADAGYRPHVRSALRAARRAEARAGRAVSHAFMQRLMAILGVSRVVRWLAGLAIDAQFVTKFLFPGGLDRPGLENPMPVPEDRPRMSTSPAGAAPEAP